ncbi:MAG: hypothetical protein U0802_22075 [Candidatus Binatia bacterium]
MVRSWRVALVASSLWAASAGAVDVTGNWSVSGASFAMIPSVSLAQNGSTVSACLSGWGTIASGTIDHTTGAFSLAFDPVFANQFDEFGPCSMAWTGTASLDGNSLTADEVVSRGCPSPVPGSCCLPAESTPIAGVRLSPTVVCCGNGIIEGGEICDSAGGSAQDCCANDCTLEPAGHFCGADDQCHLKECTAAGACASLPPADCGPCYACDPLQGCLADSRSDCAVGGRGATLRVIRRTNGSTLAWRWREGSSPETTRADFGDPTVDTDYELCVFTRDLIASGFPRVAAALPAAQSCGSGPCWTPLKSGFRYHDGAGSVAGILRAKLLARANRSSVLTVAGHNATLFPPLANEVIVQLSARDADPSRCWIATFTDPQINDPGRYAATLP